MQQKAEEWRRQGFIDPTMASQAELAYTGIVEAMADLDREFLLRSENGHGAHEAKLVPTAGSRG